MKRDIINDVNIMDEEILITPDELKKNYPLSNTLKQHIIQSRQTITQILKGDDHRLLVVCGPCSIHDPKAAIDYAKQLKQLSDELSDTLYIVMRVYFEKPRTTVGWKGLINDPYLDGSFKIEQGLVIARKLLLDLANIGLPLATEALDPNSPQYLADLFSWVAIGARTTESQTHREMASGLSMPVGFKNGTDGNLQTAINAMYTAALPHRFVGINQKGQVTLLQTRGNPCSHVILRGGYQPNYDAVSVVQCEQEMLKRGLKPTLMIDCSHGNSEKDYRRQPLVVDSIIEQILAGNHSIIGVMLESHLYEGNQSSEQPIENLCYGVSITDACIDFPTTRRVLEKMQKQLANHLINRQKRKDNG